VKRNWLAAFAIMIVASAWGATFALIKDVLRSIAPEPFIFWRFTIAGLVLCAIAFHRRVLHRNLLAPGAILGTLVFIGYWAQTRGLLFISPSRSALLTGIYVVLVPFAELLLRRKRVPLTAWIASVLAVVGTSWLIGGLDSRPTAGDLLTLACAVCFALHVVYTAEFTARHSAIGLAAVQVLVVGIAAIGPSAFAPRPPLSFHVVAVVLFTAIVTTALAFVALMWGQARVSATEAAVILSFEPVAASVVSIAFYGEPITRGTVVGGLLILAAMIVSQVPSTVAR
jgi:drug/metabolite transporter (DMT)-like permease